MDHVDSNVNLVLGYAPGRYPHRPVRVVAGSSGRAHQLAPREPTPPTAPVLSSALLPMLLD